MCETELKLMTSWIKEESDNLENHFISEGHICEKHLSRLETIINILRRSKNDEKALEN